MLLQKIVEQGSVPTLQIKVLSSAHLEKDFTLNINPQGITPYPNEEGGLALGIENGPRR